LHRSNAHNGLCVTPPPASILDHIPAGLVITMDFCQELLASCLIYARALIEYVCGCVLFQDVTVREIRGR